jgi:hypothetical protein
LAYMFLAYNHYFDADICELFFFRCAHAWPSMCTRRAHVLQ